MEHLFLSLGSNLGNMSENLSQALQLIKYRLGEILVVSSVYKNKAWGFEGDDFENLMVIVLTDFSPEKVLTEILRIETEMGRIRNQEGYENRLIDIDIVYFGDWIVKSDFLQIPHPMMHQRDFVLIPLNEIASEKKHPIFQLTSFDLLEKLNVKTNANE